MNGQILPERGPNRRPEQTPTQKSHLERLVAHYGELTGVAPGRVRRWLSVMVLLGSLDRVREADPLFLLKGGVAIELRVGAVARATKDIDLVFFGDPKQLAADLDRALGEPYSEFTFRREAIESRDRERFQRLNVRLFFRNRSWATLRLEVAPPDSASTDDEPVPAIPIDEFGLEGPTTIRCLSLRYQIAQKIHAVTERFADGENERFRDLIDLIICRDLAVDLPEVKDACHDTFSARAAHPWPPTLSVPASWAEPYTELAESMDFPVTDVEEAAREVRELIAVIDAA